jgi:predicted secreted Zn-dependent protease
VDVTLPEWPGDDVTPEVAERWSTFMAALSQHEAGHVANATASARAVERVLRSATATSCAVMRAQIGREANDVIEDYKRRDREYDERTRHGATQGVAFYPLGGGQITPGTTASAPPG